MPEVDFDVIYKRAALRKGGEQALEDELPNVPNRELLRQVGDDRVLSEMTKGIFRAGFYWQVIENKWPGFERAFEGFEPRVLLHKPDEFWEELTTDSSIVRNGAKIMAVRDNAAFVREVSNEHNGFGNFLADWPDEDITGLWTTLAKQGNRLGGMTGRYFTRFIGKDCFIPARDVVKSLKAQGVDLPDNPTAKRDLKKIESVFNAWHHDTGRSYTHLSRICAMSIGDD